jgi:drug/metabolite transporter (DMT)-like permease
MRLFNILVNMGKPFYFSAGLFAIVAAVLNGTIGPLTKIGFQFGASHHSIAFLKCLTGFVLLLIICMFQPRQRRDLVLLSTQWRQFALLSLLGIFCLYFFETWALSEASIPLVSFLTYAAGIFTLVLSSWFLRERFDLTKLFAFGFIIAGVYFILALEARLSGQEHGAVLALLGGLGYALFIFSSKYLRISSGLPQLVWLFGFGCLYLLIPLLQHGFSMPSWQAWLSILALALLPTIGGFYCTMRAISVGEAGKVQIIETSDPMFATIFAWLVFGETLNKYGILGAACIMVGLLLIASHDHVQKWLASHIN